MTDMFVPLLYLPKHKATGPISDVQSFEIISIYIHQYVHRHTSCVMSHVTNVTNVMLFICSCLIGGRLLLF